MIIKPLRDDLNRFLKDHELIQKWLKSKRLFENNPRHPSLHFEFLEPR